MLFCLLIIFIPTIIVKIFIRDDQIKFYFSENTTIRVRRQNGTIEEIPFEDYIVGVLAGEMPTDFHKEALKAQAVASRSYALVKMQENYNKDYDVTDDTKTQVYLDYKYLKEAWNSNYTNKINILKEAVIETKGQYLSYNDQVVYAFFFSTSTGVTENSGEIFEKQLPYLKSVSSTWDEKTSPVYTQTLTFTLKDFCKRLDLYECSKIETEKISTTSTGRINKIRINGNVFVSYTIVQAFGLRSNYFDIIQDGEIVNITTKGYGHGVGMSQYGAEGMANNGYTYEEILTHYYQGVKIKKI